VETGDGSAGNGGGERISRGRAGVDIEKVGESGVTVRFERGIERRSSDDLEAKLETGVSTE
jgi:hypothetical protein